MERAAQGGGGVPIPGGVQETCGCGTSGPGLAGMAVLGWHLGSMTVEFFSSLNDSKFLLATEPLRKQGELRQRRAGAGLSCPTVGARAQPRPPQLSGPSAVRGPAAGRGEGEAQPCALVRLQIPFAVWCGEGSASLWRSLGNLGERFFFPCFSCLGIELVLGQPQRVNSETVYDSAEGEGLWLP